MKILTELEKITKTAMFNQVGILTPLYVENSTIIESNTASAVKTKMKISAVFLLNDSVANFIIFSFAI